MALTILCVAFIALLILGVPVAFAIGLAAVATILYEGLPVAVVFQRMTAGMGVFSSDHTIAQYASGIWQVIPKAL